MPFWAAEIRVGRQVVRFLVPEGYLVTRSFDGGPILPQEMARPLEPRGSWR